ncbi:MAG: recombinase family protein [Acidimicrobiales bacterium]
MTLAREYLRVSRDLSGRQRSNDEQATDNRAAWPDVTWGDHYSDASSASRYSKRARDDFGQLIIDLRAAAFGADVLVLWESSRGSRKVGEWVELLDLCEAGGVRIAVTEHHRIYDPANPRDRRTLLEDAVDSEYESAKTSGRVRRSARAGAVARRPHGKVLFGYRRVYDPRSGALVGQEPHPEQAPTVRGVFRSYLGGLSARSLARALNNQATVTNRGNGWTLLMIHRMLTNRAYLGRRMHKGEDFGQGWEPLVDEATFEAVQLRREATAWRKVRRTSALCSGVARCGTCSARLEIKHSGRGNVHYGCQAGYHTYRRADDLDRWVTAAVLGRLTLPDVGDRLRGREDPRLGEARDRLENLRSSLDDAMLRWKAGGLSVQGYADMEAHLLPQIAEAEAAMRRAVLPIAIDVPAAEAVPAWWDGLAHEVRREVVASLIVGITVEPVGRGSRSIDWRRSTTIEWRR